MAIIFHVTDLQIRMQILKALQDNKLRIFPVYKFPESRNIDMLKIFRKIIGRQCRQKFWIQMPEKTILVNIPDPHVWMTVYQSMNLADFNDHIEEESTSKSKS